MMIEVIADIEAGVLAERGLMLSGGDGIVMRLGGVLCILVAVEKGQFLHIFSYFHSYSA